MFMAWGNKDMYLTLNETLAAKSVLLSLKPDWNSDTELPAACAAIFDISTATAVLDSEDVAELENFACFRQFKHV
jgi:hypothetical protein